MSGVSKSAKSATAALALSAVLARIEGSSASHGAGALHSQSQRADLPGLSSGASRDKPSTLHAAAALPRLSRQDRRWLHAGARTAGQLSGDEKLPADGDDVPGQAATTRRTWFGSSSSSGSASAHVVVPPPANSIANGEQQATGPEAEDAAQTEPIAAVNGGRSAARVRWGKAVKTVVATDGVQVFFN